MNFGELWNKLKKNWIISAIVTGLIGLVMLLFPGSVLLSACYCIGGLTIAMGVVKVVRYFKEEHLYPYIFQSDLVIGLFIIGLGLFMVTSPSVFMTLVPQLFGMLLIGCGVGNILRSIDAKNNGFGQWGVLLGMAILSIVAGLAIMSNPFGTNEALVLVTGGALVYECVADILTTLFINNKIKALQRSEKAQQ